MSIVIHAGLVSLAAQTSLAWAVHQVKHVVNGTKERRFCGEYILGNKLKKDRQTEQRQVKCTSKALCVGIMRD
jgi:hypothetical protein